MQHECRQLLPGGGTVVRPASSSDVGLGCLDAPGTDLVRRNDQQFAKPARVKAGRQSTVPSPLGRRSRIAMNA